MHRRTFWALAVSILLAGAAAGQTQEGYLDVYIAKVRPEKRAEFDAVNKKMAEANRRYKGDTWLATETTYGEQNVVSFTSLRQSYAEVEKGSGDFMGALNKAFGPAGAAKVFQDFNNCLASSQAELRRRRADLSYNAAADSAAIDKIIGEARWVRTHIVRVRPGRGPDFEAEVKEIKAARERTDPKVTTFVSESEVGQHGTVYYFTTLMPSVGGYDTIPPLSQLLGEEGLRKFFSSVADTVESAETVISRFLPELSNPPEEIASVAPDFWRPKPSAPKAMPKGEEPGKTQAKEKP